MHRAFGLGGLLVASVACLVEPIGAQPPAGGRAGRPAYCPAVAMDTTIGAAYGVLLVESSPTAVPDGLLTKALDALSVALISDTLELAPVSAFNDIVVTWVTTRRNASGESMAAWWPGHPSLATEMAFSIEPSGAITNPRILVRGDPVTADVLLRAAAKARALDQPRPSAPVRVRLRLTTNPESMEAAAPLIAVRQLTASSSIGRMLPEGSPPPAYPAWARPRGLTAVVLVWYVVDETGRVVKRAVGATSAARPADASNYESFVNAVTDVAPSWMHDRGLPSECAGRRMAVVRVEFRISRP